MIIVIPCLMEPDILETLRSLSECHGQKGFTEVIIVINESEECSPEISVFNQNTFLSLQQWAQQNSTSALRFFPVGPVKLSAKWAGAGLARKAGMDEALHRFNLLDKPEGIIVSLDADTLVENNYLSAIEEHFVLNPGDVGATLCFCHQTEGLPDRQIKGILLFEKYLHYFKNAMTFCGYPYSLYTIGSAFAVTALAYMKRGGMNRRKAGEDFYFLQTLTHSGKVGEINTTCVHPSARISERVPFGTGISMKKWMEGSDELLYAYNLQAFNDLKFLFTNRYLLFNESAMTNILEQIPFPEPVTAFLTHENLWQEIENLRCNCSTPGIFGIRFFQVFNAFRILKFLNFSHPQYYRKVLLDDCITELKSKNEGMEV